MKKSLLTIATATLGLSTVSAFAAIPTTAPYNTDTSSQYVQDQTSQGINNLNMVMCIVHGLGPAEMLTQNGTATSNGGKSVTYRALVDMNKCDPRSRSSASNSSGGASGGTSAPNYIDAVVTVSRASSSAPMIGKVWMHFTQDFGGGNQAATVSAHLSATQAPSSTLPYGAFRLDYIGKLDSTSSTAFQGFIDSSSSGLSYMENGTYGSGTKLALTASSTSAASGTMTVNNNATTYDFAYNSGYFLRKDTSGSTSYCFDRTLANANKAVWRYGTYDASTGARVDLAHPGFPVSVSYSANTYYGYAGYWGISFQGLDLNSLSNANISGMTVNDQRTGNSSTYTLHRVAGRLTKWTKNSVNLSNLDGIPFTAWADLTGKVTGNTTDVTGNHNWQMHWDSSANSNSGGFVVTGEETCSNGPCVLTTFSSTATVNAGTFANQPIMGWADAYGGNITIPPNSGNTAHTSSDSAYYYTQSTVLPGSSGQPTNLYCLNNCPTATALSSFDGTSSTSPYGNNTGNQWFSASSSSNTVSYTFGSSGLEEGTTPTAMVYTGTLSGPWQWGVMSGRLFDTALSYSNCPSGAPAGTVCEPQNPTTYYTWQTGPSQWSQSLWLVDNSTSTPVTFDPPENVSYTVPSGSAYGSWAGRTIMLQFDGFGNLEVSRASVSIRRTTAVRAATSPERATCRRSPFRRVRHSP